MKCPQCKLENPPTAMICDCGYNFETKTPPHRQRISEKASRRFIIACSIAAFLSGLLTGYGSLINNVLGTGLLGLIDVAIIWGLGFGVYKKSRVCAILLFIYYLINRPLIYWRTGSVSAIGPIAILFAVIFFLGILGTFAAHSIVKEKTGT